MWVKERTKNRTKQTIEAFAKYEGVNDLLSYLVQLDDNTVLHKDGAFSAHFRLQGPDLISSGDLELDAHSDTWHHGLSLLGDGWMVETNIIGRSYMPSAAAQDFPEILSALIDDERRLQFSQGDYFITEQILSITWKPDRLMPAKLRQFALTNEQQDQGIEKDSALFKKKLAEFTGYLSRSAKITPLSCDETISFLYQCISGGENPLAAPFVGSFLDSYLSSEPFIGGLEPKLGDKFIKVLAINDLPAQSYPCILDSLNVLPASYRWSSRFICLSQATANNYLKKHQRSWSSKAIGLMGVIRESLGLPVKLDEDAQHQADIVEMSQAENSSGANQFGFYTSTLILMDEDKGYLNKLAGEIVNHIQRLNFKVRIESVNACESYLGSLPCHGDYNLRKLLVDTRFVSHALPLSSVYQGEQACPCPLYGKDKPPLLVTGTEGNRPFMLNLHQGDVGHTAILGPTGAGKSTLIAMLMASHRKYADSRIVVLDKDGSNQRVIKALGGHYLALHDKKDVLSPLVGINKNQVETIERALQWLTGCCELQGVTMNAERQLVLRQAIEQLARGEAQYKNINHLSLQEPAMRGAIQGLNTGMFKQIMNGTQSQLKQLGVIGFDMGILLEQSLSTVSTAIITAIFNELMDCFNDKRPTLLVLEEAWLLLKHPLIQHKLTDWFKTLRKFNVSVLFVSQDLSDIVACGAGPVIQNSCMTRIYLPNAYANEPKAAEQYAAFGLNPQQIELIQKATPKQDYYYHCATGERLFQLELGELAISLLCISTKEDQEIFDDLMEEGRSDWVLQWLHHKQLTDWHDYAKQNYFQEACNE